VASKAEADSFDWSHALIYLHDFCTLHERFVLSISANVIFTDFAEKNELPLARAEMRMVRWMCGVGLCQIVSSVVLRDRLILKEDYLRVTTKQVKMVWR